MSHNKLQKATFLVAITIYGLSMWVFKKNSNTFVVNLIFEKWSGAESIFLFKLLFLKK